jgi:RNA polymerase sigma-70 factor (ECF subfamily)
MQVQSEADAARSLSDEQIVERVLAGEPLLFEIIMRRYNQRLYRAARAILGDEAEAEDVMQEAYVRAYEHLAQFGGRARFSTWLTKIAVHEALARARRRRRFESMDAGSDAEEFLAEPAHAPDPERSASDREIHRIVEDAVEALPESFRAVFVLRAVEEMSVAETAECLDLPEETVKTRLFRARARLQKEIHRRTTAAVPQVYAFHLSRCDRVVAAVLERIGARREPRRTNE